MIIMVFFALKLTMSMPIRQSPIYIFELSTKLIARDIPDCRRKVYEANPALPYLRQVVTRRLDD